MVNQASETAKNHDGIIYDHGSNMSDDDNPMIESWSPITSRLLREGGSSAWNVLDNVIVRGPSSSSGGGGPNNNSNNNDFVLHLKKELERHGWIQKLQPSRTSGEAKVEHILSKLFGTLQPQPQEQQQQSDDEKVPRTNEVASTRKKSRGDLSCFIGRGLLQQRQRQRQKRRQQQRHQFDENNRNNNNTELTFDAQYPYLSFLINSVEKTVERNLGPDNSNDNNNNADDGEERKFVYIDTDMTSVQLAMYPGDGKSGYTRHCDREKNFCRQEEDVKTQPNSTNSSSNNNERIITAVYYLTDNDWDVQRDGGCLRIYNNNYHTTKSLSTERNNNNSSSSSSNNNESCHYDVAPYSNRLIVFRSDGVEHEVLPSLRRPRLALTMWLYGKVVTSQPEKTRQETQKPLFELPAEVQSSLKSSLFPTKNCSTTTITTSNNGDSNNNSQSSSLLSILNSYSNDMSTKSTSSNDDNNNNIRRSPDTTTSRTTNVHSLPATKVGKDSIFSDPNANATISTTVPPPLPIKENNHMKIIDNKLLSRKNNIKKQHLPSIFVTIASYRDSEIGPTIQSIKETALHPERIYIGLVLQINISTRTRTTTNGSNASDDDNNGGSINVSPDTADDDLNTIIDRLTLLDKKNNKNSNNQYCNDDDSNYNTNESEGSWYRSHIRCITMDAKDATGPCYARMLGQSLLRTEDYILQIDSHMRFRYFWDQYLIEQIEQLEEYHDHNINPEITRTTTKSKECMEYQESNTTANNINQNNHKYNHNHRPTNKKQNERSKTKVMLTTYPVGYTLPNNIPNEMRGTILVPSKFDQNNDGLLRQKGSLFTCHRSSNNYEASATWTNSTVNHEVCSRNNHDMDNNNDNDNNNNNNSKNEGLPIPCYLYAGGFNFARSCVVQDCPYDGSKNTHYLFFGEELSMAVRLYTHGYDLYAPRQSVCYHLWSREYRPTLIKDSNNHYYNNKSNDTKKWPQAKPQQQPQQVKQQSKQQYYNKQQQQQRERAIDFVKEQLYGSKGSIGGLYGLGTIRTAKEFADAIGVDFKNQKMIKNTRNENTFKKLLLSSMFSVEENTGGENHGQKEAVTGKKSSPSSSLSPLHQIEKITEQSDVEDATKILQVMSSFLEQIYVKEQKQDEQKQDEQKQDEEDEKDKEDEEEAKSLKIAASTATAVAGINTTLKSEENHAQDLHHVEFHTDMVWSLMNR